MLRREPVDDRPRAVGRTVFTDEQLPRPTCSLGQDALNRLGEESFVLVSNKDDGDVHQWPAAMRAAMSPLWATAKRMSSQTRSTSARLTAVPVGSDSTRAAMALVCGRRSPTCGN